jgi:magnesium chelatase family protein
VTRYAKRLSGPILDRIDMHLTVQRVEFDKLMGAESGETSAAVRERVIAARRVQWRRFAENPAVSCNAEMRAGEIRAYCELDDEGAHLVRNAVDRVGLSARGYHRVLRLARTIADLAGAERLSAAHVGEAIHYQMRPWGHQSRAE